LPKERFEFPYHQIDLNQNFGERFGNEMFDAVCIVEGDRTTGEPEAHLSAD